MAIERLGLHHEEALRDFRDDFARAGERRVPAFFQRPEWDHAQTVRTFAAWSRGEGIGSWVPSTTLFLTEAGRILGVTNVRHRLTPELERHGGNVGYSVRPSARRCGHGTTLLAAAKDHARELGLSRILVTCEPSNVGSVRVIEANGGVLLDERYHEGERCLVRRYWIEL